MKKYLYLVVFAVVLLFLSACMNLSGQYTTPPTMATSPTVTEEPIITTPPTTQAATQVPTEATTVPTAPLHSSLYLPDYTAEQIIDYFEEVVLNIEYTDGTGNANLVQKWMCPIYYRVYGSPTDEDLAVLEDLFAQLNAVPGFPGIYAATNETPENLSLSFLDAASFKLAFSDVVGGEDANGATQFWYYTATNDIYTARIGYRTDVDQASRNSILIEEVINTLGISDTVLRPDSIVYQYSDANTALSDVDRILLHLLYDPAILCGMDAGSCAAIIQALYY